MINSLDIQARLDDLIADVGEAIQATRADFDYDQYLANGDLSDTHVEEFLDRISDLGELNTLLQWYKTPYGENYHRRPAKELS